MLRNKNYILLFLPIVLVLYTLHTFGQANDVSSNKDTSVSVDPGVVEPLRKILPYEKKLPKAIEQEVNKNANTNQLAKDNISIDEIRNVKPLYSENKTILFYLFLVMVLIVGFVKSSYTGYLSAIQRSIFNTNLAHQFHRTMGARMVQPFSMLFIFNLLSISTLLYLITQNFSDYIFTAPIQHFFIILLVVAAYHVFKLFLNNFLSSIFKLKNVLSFYQFNFFLVEVAVCILIIPLLMLATFNGAFNTKILLLICLSIFIIGHLYAYFKGILSSLRLIVFHKFYFFLYFCILEIGPFLILFKIMDNWLMLG